MATNHHSSMQWTPAIERSSTDAASRTNRGWILLARNEPGPALDCFVDALRLDPTLAAAREGLREALKARSYLYRGMLLYYTWTARLSLPSQGVFIGATLVASHYAHSYMSRDASHWWMWPVLIAFYAFIYLSWTAYPMFTLLQALRHGRLVLSSDERVGAAWFGGSLALVLGAVTWWGSGGGELAMFASVSAAMLSICIAAVVLHTREARRRLLIMTAGLALVAFSFVVLSLAGSPHAVRLQSLFLWGFLGFQLIANVMRGGIHPVD